MCSFIQVYNKSWPHHDSNVLFMSLSASQPLPPSPQSASLPFCFMMQWILPFLGKYEHEVLSISETPLLTSLNTMMSPSSPWPALIPLHEEQSHESLPHWRMNVYRLSLIKILCRRSQLCPSFFSILNIFNEYVRACTYISRSMPRCTREVRGQISEQFSPPALRSPGAKFIRLGSNHLYSRAILRTHASIFQERKSNQGPFLGWHINWDELILQSHW